MAISSKLALKKKLFSTQCIILFIFLWFSQIKIAPPPIITKVHLPLIITKVNALFVGFQLFMEMDPREIEPLLREIFDLNPGNNDIQHIGITYNINHGVQIMGSVMSFYLFIFNFQYLQSWSWSASALQHESQGQGGSGSPTSLHLTGEHRPATPQHRGRQQQWGHQRQQ